MRKLIRQLESSPAKAATGFLHLARQSKSNVKKTICTWHVEQALGMASEACEAEGNHRRLESVLRELIELHKAEAAYYGHALAHSSARLALCCFRTGKKKEGLKLAYEALQRFGEHAEPASIIETLGKRLREYGRLRKV